jgi:hypothetical protein
MGMGNRLAGNETGRVPSADFERMGMGNRLAGNETGRVLHNSLKIIEL